jgi:hypothetical protein
MTNELMEITSTLSTVEKIEAEEDSMNEEVAGHEPRSEPRLYE